MPVGVEYRITPLGESLRQPFEALYRWALEYGPQLTAAQDEYDQKSAEAERALAS
jgi:DNA-binding HxlR family transcriptional regulator